MHLNLLQGIKLIFDCSKYNPRYFPIKANNDLYVLFVTSTNCLQQEFLEFVAMENLTGKGLIKLIMLQI